MLFTSSMMALLLESYDVADMEGTFVCSLTVPPALSSMSTRLLLWLLLEFTNGRSSRH